MLDSDTLWKSIDKIAERTGKSLPRLAIDANLDQSTFSIARRKRNWMSLQTLAKVLNSHDIPISEWASIIEEIQEEDRRGKEAYSHPTIPMVTLGHLP